MPKMLGICDDITACDCCGRSHLKCTVAIELDCGEVVHYGRDCAAAHLRKPGERLDAALIERRARALTKLAPVFEAIRTALPGGLADAIVAGRAAAKPIWINGASVGVAGYSSWGCIRVDWNGGTEQIPLVEA